LTGSSVRLNFEVTNVLAACSQTNKDENKPKIYTLFLPFRTIACLKLEPDS
jgi:hypothetical protein